MSTTRRTFLGWLAALPALPGLALLRPESDPLPRIHDLGPFPFYPDPNLPAGVTEHGDLIYINRALYFDDDSLDGWRDYTYRA